VCRRTVCGVADERAAVVARRAAELALATGVALPDHLALWSLAGGRPRAEPVPGEPDELGRLLEGSFGEAARRRQGAHFTPASLAAEIAERALAGRTHATVGDPACGGGALLLAAAGHLAARGAARSQIVAQIWAADIDPLAVATTEAALALWAGEPPPAAHLAVADGLLDDLGWPPLDVVVGNPPFLSQLGADTARDATLAARLRERFGDDVVRAYTDPAALFLLRACHQAAPGGTVALIQPQSSLASRDAAGVRAAVVSRARVDEIWFPDDAGFDASVDVCVPVLTVGATGRSVPWSSHLARAHGVPDVALSGSHRVGEEATTTAGFRGEYYGMVEHVREASHRPDGSPVVTTGMIDLGRVAWGERAARIGRRRWERPVVDLRALEARAADWARRTSGPKLLVATQTRVVEVAVDDEGRWLPAVPLVVVLAPVERLWPLASAIAAPAVTAWALARVAGAALSPRALKVTASLLRDVPLPTDGEAWARGTEAFRAGDLEGFVDAMAAAYAVGPEVGEWWTDRARSAWSPVAAGR